MHILFPTFQETVLDRARDVSKIEKSNLDGSERQVLIDTDIFDPHGIAIDFEGKRKYYTGVWTRRWKLQLI